MGDGGEVADVEPCHRQAIISHEPAVGLEQYNAVPALDWTDDRIIRMAILLTKVGTFTPCSRPFSTISSASWCRSAKGESRI
jgi:hypothetical protein